MPEDQQLEHEPDSSSDSGSRRAPDAISAVSESEQLREFYGDRVSIVTPETYEELADVVRSACEEKRTVIPTGGGHHAHVGVPPEGYVLAVSMRNLNRVLRYERDDFTLGVQSGMPLADLRRVLSENRQEIPVDVSSSYAGTVGGWIAIGFPGPRQSKQGLLRNYLIGTHGLRARLTPELYKTGGMVVKNVAGYDVGKFLIGSLGTAGFLLEANFKLCPLPARRSLRFAMFGHRREAGQFVQALRRKGLEPAILQVLGGRAAAHLSRRVHSLDAEGHWLLWAFEGNDSQVTWQERELDRLLLEHAPSEVPKADDVDAANTMDFLSEFVEPSPLVAELDTPPNELGVVRIGVLPGQAREVEQAIHDQLENKCQSFATLVDALAGMLTVRWQRREGTVGDVVEFFRHVTTQYNGKGALIYLPRAERVKPPYYQLAPAPSASLAASVRRVFDSHDLFYPGRILAHTPTTK